VTKELIMTTIELKSNLHRMIDSISDEGILSTFFDLLSRAKSSKDGALWSKLTLEERDELLAIEKESRDPKNLISHGEMKTKHQKWL